MKKPWAGCKSERGDGDIMLVITLPDGTKQKMDLFAGEPDEDLLHYGGKTYHGSDMSPAYVSVQDFKAVQKDLAGWQRGDASKLRQQYNQLRQELHGCTKFVRNQGNGQLLMTKSGKLTIPPSSKRLVVLR